MKKLFTKIHLWLSIPLGLIISIICLTGAALVFEQEITQALNPHIYQVKYQEGCVTLKPSELVERIKEQTGDSLELTSLQYSGKPDEPCMASFKNTGRQTLSVNPYTGDVNGWTKSNSFFQTMKKLHRWLLDAPAKKGEKSVGKVIVGITTLAMVFILISGIIIWIPRSRKALKNRLQVSCTKGWRRFWYDSHVTLGFYTTIFLLLMALTGLTWSFSWYRTTAYGLFGGNERNQTKISQNGEKDGKDKKARHDGKENKTFDYAVWDNVLSELQSRYPIYKSITLNEQNAQIAPNPGSYMRQTDKAIFNPHNGKIQEISYYKDTPRSQTLKGFFYSLHTGTWGGITTKVLYFLSAFIGGILPLSGYYLWLKKKRRTPKNI